VSLLFAGVVITVACGRSLIGTSLDVPTPLGVLDLSATSGELPKRETVLLGRALFFDKGLSRDGDKSCATCHIPERAFTETLQVSNGVGAEARRRNTMSLLNVAFVKDLAWDGRFSSLESQLDAVFSDSGDVGVSLPVITRRLAADARYIQLFKRAFGRSPSELGVRLALAAFQRTLVSGSSRFDRYLFDGDSSALTPNESYGFAVFQAKGCVGCHVPIFPATNVHRSGVAFFTDNRFHNLGVGFSTGKVRDAGRYEVTGETRRFGAFRTPSLRNVALTAPYMHDGSIATLEDVVQFYDQGGHANPNLDPVIRPLGLIAAERDALVAFMRSLTSEPLFYDVEKEAVQRWPRFERLNLALRTLTSRASRSEYGRLRLRPAGVGYGTTQLACVP
jgi:cytochrome c peroxidase